VKPVKRSSFIPVVGVLIVIGVCSGCLWSVTESPRFTQRFEVGNNRTITVSSTRRNEILESIRNFDLDLDPNPWSVYFRLDEGDREIWNHWRGPDNNKKYRFRMVTTEDRLLVCIYDVNETDRPLMLLYDVASGHSWPRDEYPKAKWRERFQLLKKLHPELPTPSDFQGSQKD
jgi:hypothetical protein